MTLALAAVTLALAAVMLTLAVATLRVAISRIALDRAAIPNLHPLVEEAPAAALCPTPRAGGTESGMLPGICLPLRCRVVDKTVPRLLERGEPAAEIDHGAQ